MLNLVLRERLFRVALEPGLKLKKRQTLENKGGDLRPKDYWDTTQEGPRFCHSFGRQHTTSSVETGCVKRTQVLSFYGLGLGVPGPRLPGHFQ